MRRSIPSTLGLILSLEAWAACETYSVISRTTHGAHIDMEIDDGSATQVVELKHYGSGDIDIGAGNITGSGQEEVQDALAALESSMDAGTRTVYVYDDSDLIAEVAWSAGSGISWSCRDDDALDSADIYAEVSALAFELDEVTGSESAAGYLSQAILNWAKCSLPTGSACP